MKTLETILTLSLLTVPIYSDNSPYLKIRSSPTFGMAGISKPFNWTVYVELKGNEQERLYCPEIRWIIGQEPNTITSSQESDCIPWEQHTKDDYEKFWYKHFNASLSGDYQVCVELRKNNKVLLKDCVITKVIGGR